MSAFLGAVAGGLGILFGAAVATAMALGPGAAVAAIVGVGAAAAGGGSVWGWRALYRYPVARSEKALPMPLAPRPSPAID